MIEIGSEFWLEKYKADSSNFVNNLGKDIKFLLSGRTAIDFVLKDIKCKRKINKAYIPSYCCESMLVPFVENNIDIEFYDVNYKDNINYNINLDNSCDIFLGVSYFGYTDSNMDKYIEELKNRKNIIVLEDITHRLFSKKNFCNLSDYLIASIRKWGAFISGGIAISKNGEFDRSLKTIEANNDMIRIKNEAMTEKEKYILENKSIDKTIFLNKYEYFNKFLQKNYKLYDMDKTSIENFKRFPIDDVIEKRIKNATIIENELIGIDGIKIMFKLKDGDCPLFVPILISDYNKFKKLKEILKEEKIYLPSHWNKSNIIPEKLSNIYNKEISLVCDQRYNENEVKKYILMLKNVWREI